MSRSSNTPMFDKHYEQPLALATAHDESQAASAGEHLAGCAKCEA